MIITYQQFWKDFDRGSEELNTSVVSAQECGDTVITHVYFDGLKGECGVCRIYAKIAAPKRGTDKAVIVLDDIQNNVELFDCQKFLSMGFAVIIMDYAGESENFGRFTLYPKCFSFANYFQNKDCLHKLPENLIKSCRYIWTALLLRCVTFAESEGFSRIGLLGIGEGGSEVIKALTLEPSLKCGATLFSHSRITEKDEKDYDPDLLAYSAALGVVNYAPFLKIPLFMQLTSNEQNFPLDKMVRIYSMCAEGTALLAISERSDRIISSAQENNIYLFFEKVFLGDTLIKAPKITAKNSSNSLYITVFADSSAEIEDAALYVARAQKISAYRNWRKISLEKTAAGEYLAKIPVYSDSDTVYAFVNIKYANSFCVSSSVLSILPSSLNITPVNFTAKHLIYDVDSGVSEWIVTGKQQNIPLTIEKGPFDIEGICANLGKIATFALADKMYSPAQDASLQFLIYSFSEQNITFSLKTSDSDKVFNFTKVFIPEDNWVKVTLSASHFKSGDGTLDSWSKVVMFEITSNDKFLINTMLWI